MQQEKRKVTSLGSDSPATAMATPLHNPRTVSPGTAVSTPPTIKGDSIAVPASASRAILNDIEKEETHLHSEDGCAPPPLKRRLAFGRAVDATSQTHVPSHVKEVYRAIQKHTGSIGGNGSFGAIYGELTVGSMQKMIDLMKIHTNLDETSKFVDVGSGLGKPNLHVAQDPGVAFSYGIEMERVRWMLGMSNLDQVLGLAARKQQLSTSNESPIGYNCMLAHGNILEAKTFDPFTHVYMFSIGFPPNLWVELSKMFNKSTAAEYLICYHSPKAIIDRYGFDVELITQASTSMHGSSEGHMGYIYSRKPGQRKCKQRGGDPCDALFKEAYELVKKSDLKQMVKYVNAHVEEQYRLGRRTRSSGVVMSALPTPSPDQKKRSKRKLPY